MSCKTQGIFITVEGAEGVGKSTFAGLLEKKIAERGVKTYKTREPGGTFIAEQLRDIFSLASNSEPLTMQAELMILSGARSQHVAYGIKPRLEQDIWVICDRFFDSTFVYQGLIGGISLLLIEEISKVCTQGLTPNVTFLVTCEVDAALERISARGEVTSSPQRYDQAEKDFHSKLREGFLEVARKNPKRICVLDSTKLSPEELVQQAIQHLEKEAYFG